MASLQGDLGICRPLENEIDLIRYGGIDGLNFRFASCVWGRGLVYFTSISTEGVEKFAIPTLGRSIRKAVNGECREFLDDVERFLPTIGRIALRKSTFGGCLNACFAR